MILHIIGGALQTLKNTASCSPLQVNFSYDRNPFHISRIPYLIIQPLSGIGMCLIGVRNNNNNILKV